MILVALSAKIRCHVYPTRSVRTHRRDVGPTAPADSENDAQSIALDEEPPRLPLPTSPCGRQRTHDKRGKHMKVPQGGVSHGDKVNGVNLHPSRRVTVTRSVSEPLPNSLLDMETNSDGDSDNSSRTDTESDSDAEDDGYKFK